MKREMLALALAAGMPAANVDYGRDIQPIFEKRCVMCHSENATMGSLNLETYAGLQKGGNNGPVVSAGAPADSLLYRSLVGQAPEIGRMPIGLEPVPPKEVAMVKAWIEEGAQGPVTAKVAAAPARARQIYALAYRPDGKALAVAEYQSVVLLDGASQKETARLDGHADAVRAVAWSRDGGLLAAAGGAPGRKGEIKIWKVDGTLQASGERACGLHLRGGGFARWGDDCFGELRQADQAVGCGDGQGTEDAQGSHGRDLCAGVYAGRQAVDQRRGGPDD